MKRNMKRNSDGLDGVKVYRKSCGVLQTEVIFVHGVPQPPSRGVLMRLKQEREERKR